MKKTVLVRGPVLTQSGYGEHARFVLRALRLQEDHLNIHVLPVGWGETGWLSTDDEERRWIDSRVEACKNHLDAKLPYDISVQVTIPNEWQKIATVDIGVTAGIETNKIAPIWIQKANEMDKIVVVSEHAKKGFTETVYQGHNPSTGQPAELRCVTPVEVAHYPVKTHQASDTPILELDYDFNFLAIGQWGPRKNLQNLIKWFVEENFDQEVGLVVKTSIKNNSYIDREHAEGLVRACVPDIPERKCKVYLVHGDLSETEMHSLYTHPKIKSMVSLTHGEGFGLPLFEAAYSGLPIIAPGWSGQADFLYAPFESTAKKSKGKKVYKPMFAEVDFTIGPVQPETVWQGVIEKDSSWCYPAEGSFKLRMKQMRNGYTKWLEKAAKLQEWVQEEFEWDKKHTSLSYMINTPDPALTVSLEDLPKISLITSVYNAAEHIEQLMQDTTRQTIFKEKCQWIILNANEDGDREEEIILSYVEKYPDNIVYKRLDEDGGVYDTWNQAIKMSDGEYITNINCDDRRAPDALERQAKSLYADQNIDLVYSDSYMVETANLQWEDMGADTERYNFDEFSKEAMLRGNLPHNNPMWRRSLHDNHGLFDTKYRSAADWDFWLRCAFGGAKFKKLSQILGVYYFNPHGVSTNKDTEASKRKEEFEIFKVYQKLFLKSKQEQ
jgi:glycosyltransferase involved in cell wall biosynthesis